MRSVFPAFLVIFVSSWYCLLFRTISKFVVKLHSGKPTKLAGTWTRNEDVFPIEHGDSPASYDSLPDINEPRQCLLVVGQLEEPQDMRHVHDRIATWPTIESLKKQKRVEMTCGPRGRMVF